MDDEFLGVVKQNADNKIGHFSVLRKISDCSWNPPFLQGSLDIGKNGQKGVDLMKQEGTIQTRR